MAPFRLAVIAAIAGALAFPASSQPRPTVTIILGSHYFQPSPIYLAGGVPVRMMFINRAGKTHDFTAPAFFRSSRILAGNPRGGRLKLKAGGATVIDLVPQRGTYNVHCSMFMHDALGMRSRIVVG